MPDDRTSRPDEFELIERYFRPLAGSGALDLTDDAARILVRHSPGSAALADPAAGEAGSPLIVSTDMIAESVHFLPSDPPGTIARKALRVNISDLVAKGARPLAYTLGLGLWPNFDEAWIEAFCDGLADDQQRYGIDLIGGDTITLRGTPPAAGSAQPVGAGLISVTVMGTPCESDMIRRSGGQPGDRLFVSGVIGSAVAGLALLTEEGSVLSNLPVGIKAQLIERYRVPDPPAALAPVIARFANAAMDISDGLVGDCDKLAAASKCGGIIEADRVPIHKGLDAFAADDALLMELLAGGDDYQVLAAIPADRASDFQDAAEALGQSVTDIGRLTGEAGPIQVIRHGGALAVKDRSYTHAPAKGQA